MRYDVWTSICGRQAGILTIYQRACNEIICNSVGLFLRFVVQAPELGMIQSRGCRAGCIHESVFFPVISMS
jgi:hypothetical protein